MTDMCFRSITFVILLFICPKFSVEEDINLELELTFNDAKDADDMDGYGIRQYNRQRPGNNTHNHGNNIQAASSSTTSKPPSKTDGNTGLLFEKNLSNYIYNPLDFNSTVDTLQRSFFHTRANE